LTANYVRYGSFADAAKCIDISKVVASAALGAIGASPVGVVRKGGSRLQAGGVLALGSYSKIGLPKITIGDECECDGGNVPEGPLGTVLTILEGLQL